MCKKITIKIYDQKETVFFFYIKRKYQIVKRNKNKHQVKFMT